MQGMLKLVVNKMVEKKKNVKCVLLNEKLIRRVDETAAEEDRPFSYVVRKILEKHYEEHKSL